MIKFDFNEFEKALKSLLNYLNPTFRIDSNFSVLKVEDKLSLNNPFLSFASTKLRRIKKIRSKIYCVISIQIKRIF